MRPTLDQLHAIYRVAAGMADDADLEVVAWVAADPERIATWRTALRTFVALLDDRAVAEALACADAFFGVQDGTSPACALLSVAQMSEALDALALRK